MRCISLTWLIPTLFLLLSCESSHGDLQRQIEQLKSEDSGNYAIVYAYATFLYTNRSIEPDQAIPMINEMISSGYPAEARYSINNLKRNGIHSYDLLALRGLCYQLELQPELAMADFLTALKGDPDNDKIKTLLKNARGDQTMEKEQSTPEDLFQKGIACVQNQEYDAALSFMKNALEMEQVARWEGYVTQITKVMEGERMIEANPSDFRGFIQKSQGQAAMALFVPAQETLDAGLKNNEDNLNLMLAKALVWVQAGETETARQYLWEQEQRGISIDPGIKKQILQQQN